MQTRSHPAFDAHPKEDVPMRPMKRTLIKTAAIGSVLVGVLAVASPASANSFGPTDRGTGGIAWVRYNDAKDEFCVTDRDNNPTGTRVAIWPANGRGPRYSFYVPYSLSKCVSLSRAYEDTLYYYQIIGHKRNAGPGLRPPVSFYS